MLQLAYLEKSASTDHVYSLQDLTQKCVELAQKLEVELYTNLEMSFLSGIGNVEGIKFTVQAKEELLSSLKIAMEQNRLAIPYLRQLCEQINEQQYSYSKSGHLKFRPS